MRYQWLITRQGRWQNSLPDQQLHFLIVMAALYERCLKHFGLTTHVVDLTVGLSPGSQSLGWPSDLGSAELAHRACLPIQQQPGSGAVKEPSVRFFWLLGLATSVPLAGTAVQAGIFVYLLPSVPTSIKLDDYRGRPYASAKQFGAEPGWCSKAG